ncbi:hypothetical protein G9A89_020397 [Geosiphon pyriformis]|nr:hypothetical protein G9A89_020397 [Geosiphon pyriformis]
MIILNSFVVPDKIFGKISTVAASPLFDMDDNSSGISSKMGQDQLLVVLSDVVLFGRSLPISVAKQYINPNDLKDWADQMEMELTVSSPVSGAADSSAWENESLNGATKVAISDKVLLTTFKIAQSSGVTSVFSPSLSVTLHDISLSTFSDNIKTALGIFDISSVAAALSNWSVLVRKDSVRILSIVNQKKVIFSRDAFKAKLVNLPFGCTAFEINCKKLLLFSPKLSFNIFGDPKNFKPSFVGSKSYAKTAAFVVPLGATAANMDLDLGGSPKTVISMLPAVSFALNSAVKSRLASLEFYLSELSVLIKSLVEPVGALVALVTKLLSTSSAVNVSIKEYVNKLAKQNKGLAAVATMMQKKMTCLEKICEWACLKDGSNVNNMVDNDDDNNNKDFSVYDNTFDVIMHL